MSKFNNNKNNIKIAIILNGYINNKSRFLNKIANFKHIACADGGCKHILNFNLKNKLLFIAGDFDSFPEPYKYFDQNIIYSFNPEKDFTDSYGAYLIAKNKFNFKEFHFFACSGKREDHFLSLIFSFVNKDFINNNDTIYFHTDFETFSILKPGKYTFKMKNSQFSLFPLLPVKKLEMVGTKYKFQKKDVSFTGQGVSNIFTEDTSYISFKKGLILFSVLENESL